MYDIVGPHVFHQLGAIDFVDFLVDDHKTLDWLVGLFDGVQLLLVSDVAQQKSFVFWVQQILSFRYLIGKDYWAHNCPTGSKLCGALKTAKGQKELDESKLNFV